MIRLLIKFTVLFFSLLSFIACEDVVDIDLKEAPQKLVVEASIKWEKGTSGADQLIRLTKTSNFYTNEVPVVSGAIVYITDSNNNQFDFIESIGTGNYICANFNPILNETYTLTISSEGQLYQSTEKLISVPIINSVQQRNDGGFGGDSVEVKFFFQDNGLEDNYYLVSVENAAKNFPEFNIIDDKFFQGNQMFGIYSDSDLKATDVLDLSVEGISKNYYNYLNILLSVSSNSGGGPFQTAPATVKGNIKNTTKAENYPFGFFRLSEMSTQNYVIQ